jgi:hypothetical protein
MCSFYSSEFSNEEPFLIDIVLTEACNETSFAGERESELSELFFKKKNEENGGQKTRLVLTKRGKKETSGDM